MKLLKKPVFWVAIAVLALLAFTVSGFLEPAQVRFVNETNFGVQNLRLSFASGASSIPILPAGESIQGPIALASGELSISLETPDGTPHTQTFGYRWAPRETVIFHVVDSAREESDAKPTFRANRMSTEVNYTFSVRTTAR
jgi:hypothetical protein